MSDLIVTAVGGGLLGWLYTRVRDAWWQRPILYWDPYLEAWRRTCTHPA